MTYDEIKAAWNAQADEHNQWDELGEDEKIEWAAIHAAAKERAARIRAQEEVVALKERITRAGVEQRRAVSEAVREAVLAEREAGFHVLDKPLLVHIEWRDHESDWPWFWLLATRGEWLHLQGADYPDGSAKHRGDCFWVHKSGVRTMDGNAWTTNNSTPV